MGTLGVTGDCSQEEHLSVGGARMAPSRGGGTGAVMHYNKSLTALHGAWELGWLLSTVSNPHGGAGPFPTHGAQSWGRGVPQRVGKQLPSATGRACRGARL